MRAERTLSFLIVALMVGGLGVMSLAQEPANQVPAKEVPKQEEPKKEAPKKPREQKKIFCATNSAPLRALMIDNVNCDDQCKGAFREYQCDTNQYLKEGWKITGFASAEISITRPPCECRLSGTEAQLER